MPVRSLQQMEPQHLYLLGIGELSSCRHEHSLSKSDGQSTLSLTIRECPIPSDATHNLTLRTSPICPYGHTTNAGEPRRSALFLRLSLRPRPYSRPDKELRRGSFLLFLLTTHKALFSIQSTCTKRETDRAGSRYALRDTDHESRPTSRPCGPRATNQRSRTREENP